MQYVCPSIPKIAHTNASPRSLPAPERRSPIFVDHSTLPLRTISV